MCACARVIFVFKSVTCACVLIVIYINVIRCVGGGVRTHAHTYS